MIEAKIVADSVGPNGKRVTTFVVTYPRFIHSELMTHRMLSRNASSSRAIPVKKQIQMVIDNPAIPLAFTKNKAGMQGGEALSGDQEAAAVSAWLAGRDSAVGIAIALSDLEVHKQYANRVLEPYAHITVVITATELTNFFALRVHPMAQPEICELATQMWNCYRDSLPDLLIEGDWHLPFVTNEDPALTSILFKHLDDHSKTQLKIKMSVARCARVSYLNHEGKQPSLEEDLQLFDRLLGGMPIHASPAEHQAQALKHYHLNGECTSDDQSGNFFGWTQYRKTLSHENIMKFDGPSEV